MAGSAEAEAQVRYRAVVARLLTVGLRERVVFELSMITGQYCSLLQYRGSGDKKECVNGIGGRVTGAVVQVLVQHH